MSHHKPRVSIGIPVFNGEQYLEEAIDSILVQTYADFELIISDNASTDRTQEICRAYTKQDRRIRYYRNATNVGASKNFNRVFELSLGDYFKWAAYDDILAPDFLLKCVEVLDQDPSVVLCFSKMQIIDEDGKVMKNCRIVKHISSVKPHDRFAYLAMTRHGCHHIWGLIRKSVLKKTSLIGNYISSDVTLIAEIGLYGRFYDYPENLFTLRGHSERSVYAYPFYLRAAWFDPENEGKIIFPNWRIFGEHLKSIRRVSLRWNERILCYIHMIHWLLAHWNFAKMAMDLLMVVFPKLWGFDLKAKKWYHRRKKRLRAAKLKFPTYEG